MVTSRKDRLVRLKNILDVADRCGKLPSVAELAKLLDVSVPTVYQDFVLLRVSGATRIMRLRRSKGCAVEELLKEVK